MDTSGFITPPPGLVPPRDDTDTRTERMPRRGASFPSFNAPPAPAVQTPPVPRTWLVILPTGARIPVNGSLLVGRNPVRFEPWTRAELLPVDDPVRSVSKTHALIEVVGDGIRVTDLHSTNGVSVLDASGAAMPLSPGAATAVAAGAAVLFGSYRVQLVVA
ncbi:FHA domain-containing protein [Rathayibacter sp. CAU 1779]